MPSTHRFADICHFLVSLPQQPCAVTRSIVHRNLAFDGLLQLRRQCLTGSKHIRKIRVAAVGWNFKRMQYSGFGRHIDVGHVGMPYGLAIAEIADRFTIFDNVGDDVNFWEFLVERLSIRIWSGRIEFSKVFAEREELWVR